MKRYRPLCDFTGLTAKYRDLRSKLRFHSIDEVKRGEGMSEMMK